MAEWQCLWQWDGIFLIAKISKIQSTDDGLNRFQDKVVKAVNQLIDAAVVVTSGIYLPVFTVDAAVTTYSPFYWSQNNNLVTVIGYALLATGASTVLTMTLPVQPQPFGANIYITRAQLQGSFIDDSGINQTVEGQVNGVLLATSSAAPAGATGMRFNFTYRLSN